MLIIKDPSTIKVGYTKELLKNNKTTSELAEKNKALCAVNSSLPLIENGKPLLSKNTMWEINPRTAIAQKKDGTVIMVVIDGRNTNSIGISLFKLQQLLIKEGAYTAAALDGGSSSTMYYKDGIINKPAYSNGQQPVSSIFMVEK
ncbi:phosphodiester glycosidase family protein [Clostridium sp. Mt-5]|uniref:Phosphodiester glycosidase family protein n=1 Tax=Clostridium moutaii TaxID=3240932 RepID=A0ABV4BJL5_9CLOT